MCSLKTFNDYLAFYCAPVLIGIKTANLFSYPVKANETMRNILKFWNDLLLEKDKSIVPLAQKGRRTIFYVYDIRLLNKQLQLPDVITLLKLLGYPSSYNTVDKLLCLSEKLNNKPCFPHELGIFLGYPLIDVVGFITNQGKNYHCSGYWKVYGNKEETLKLFHTYSVVQKYFQAYLKKGLSIPQTIPIVKRILFIRFTTCPMGYFFTKS